MRENLGMKGNRCKVILSRAIVSTGIAIFMIGCAAQEPPAPIVKVVREEVYVAEAPGAVQYVYEPPMADVVDVPPGLDPEGIYYRPAHKAVVEIRPGRWQHYKEEGK